MSSLQDILSGNKPVVVDFFADWCEPCKMMTPILNELKEKFDDQITIVKIDIEKNKEFAAKHMIQSVPTLIIFKDGVEQWRRLGVSKLIELENHIENLI
ncbi:thioredoxin [Flavobacteriaceae bacterium Ap0902]|nr:thioredoxin [Flavobacteriaceae bacterium Ap0902]